MNKLCKKEKNNTGMSCSDLFQTSRNWIPGINPRMTHYQRGRSMVEMLGVLAVMGVLSVGGVAMYTSAMNKHKANELLNEASKRAVVVATRALTGQQNVSLGEFSGHSSVAGGTFADEEAVDASGNTFAIKIKGVDSAVCTQMKNSIGSNTVVRGIPETCGTEVISLVFNKDLSKTSLSSEPLIDTSIDNQEDCQEAGKTWCYASTGSSSNGVCSNVTDCCKTVTLNSCQTCQSVQGQYVVDYKITGASCNFQGTNDGQCLPYAPTGSRGCGATNIQNMCLNDMEYAQSETEKSCLPVPCSAVGNCCKAVGEDGLYDVYGQDGLKNLMDQLQEALGNNDLSKGVGLIDQINVAQCTSCDSTDGSLTTAPDNTSCYYLEGETLLQNYSNMNNFTDVTLPGKCKSGKCSNTRDGFFCDFYIDEEETCHERYSCDIAEDIEVDDSERHCSDPCPNRKLYWYNVNSAGGLEPDTLCVLNCPTGSFMARKNSLYKVCYPCNLKSAPEAIDTDSCVDACQNSGYPRKISYGKCIPDDACSTYTECGEGKYCDFSIYLGTYDKPGAGHCVDITQTEKDNHYSSKNMNWYAAYSFCKGLNMSLPPSHIGAYTTGGYWLNYIPSDNICHYSFATNETVSCDTLVHTRCINNN